MHQNEDQQNNTCVLQNRWINGLQSKVNFNNAMNKLLYQSYPTLIFAFTANGNLHYSVR